MRSMKSGQHIRLTQVSLKSQNWDLEIGAYTAPRLTNLRFIPLQPRVSDKPLKVTEINSYSTTGLRQTNLLTLEILTQVSLSTNCTSYSVLRVYRVEICMRTFYKPSEKGRLV